MGHDPTNKKTPRNAQKVLELINKFSKAAWCKINIYNATAVLYARDTIQNE